jgi:hypothetical protein
MRFLLAAILLLCGCGLKKAEHLDVLFDAASEDLRAGELAAAPPPGRRAPNSRHDVVISGRAAYYAGSPSYSQRAEEVLNQL